jgi:hypothetical protein
VAVALAHTSQGKAALMDEASKVLRKRICSPMQSWWSMTGLAESGPQALTLARYAHRNQKNAQI